MRSPSHCVAIVDAGVELMVVSAACAAAVLLVTMSAVTVRLPAVTLRKISCTSLPKTLRREALNAPTSKVATSPAIAKVARTAGM